MLKTHTYQFILVQFAFSARFRSLACVSGRTEHTNPHTHPCVPRVPLPLRAALWKPLPSLVTCPHRPRPPPHLCSPSELKPLLHICVCFFLQVWTEYILCFVNPEAALHVRYASLCASDVIEDSLCVQRCGLSRLNSFPDFFFSRSCYSAWLDRRCVMLRGCSQGEVHAVEGCKEGWKRWLLEEKSYLTVTRRKYKKWLKSCTYFNSEGT